MNSSLEKHTVDCELCGVTFALLLYLCDQSHMYICTGVSPCVRNPLGLGFAATGGCSFGHWNDLLVVSLPSFLFL